VRWAPVWCVVAAVLAISHAKSPALNFESGSSNSVQQEPETRNRNPGNTNSSSPPKANYSNSPTVFVVVGAEGEDKYAAQFRAAAELWQKAAVAGGATCRIIGVSNATPGGDVEQLRGALAAEPTNGLAELWVVLIGHGTWDGKQANFNMRGPDLSATNLATWLRPFRRPVAVIDCSSSSAPFMKALSQTNRIVVTATRSGAEQNYARFGTYMAQAIASPDADLDKDGQTSLLEAFLYASRQVSEFYKNEGRLATEHALLDDNGDGMGTPADWFRGVRAIKVPSGGAADGLRAHQWHLVRNAGDQALTAGQRQQRDELELQIARLRQRKTQMNEDEYYNALEKLLLSLSKFITATNQ